MPDPVTTVLHLTSSRFYGGPERQMLGLAEALRPDVQTVIASFSEDGLNRAFLDQVQRPVFQPWDWKMTPPICWPPAMRSET